MHFYGVWCSSVIFQEAHCPAQMDRFFFWFQPVKSCLIRSYLILLEQRFTIGLQGGWWKMTQSAVCYGGLCEGHLSTKTSLTQAMPPKDIFPRGTDIMTCNIMGQEVEKPVYLCRVTLLLHWEPWCFSVNPFVFRKRKKPGALMSDEKEWTLIYWRGSLEFFSYTALWGHSLSITLCSYWDNYKV